MIYHITSQTEWDQALNSGGYTPTSSSEDGFIHCSDIYLVEGVANRFYKDLEDLIVLEIDPERTSMALVYENLEGGTTLFPHLYGSPLPVESVTDTFALNHDNQGNLHLPVFMQRPKPPLFTLLPFNQPGKVYRSVMPGSFLFDPTDQVMSLYQQAGIQSVVVLNPKEDLEKFTQEDLLLRYRSVGINIIHAPVADFSAPAHGAWNKDLAYVENLIRSGETIAIHCHAGIGRTGMFVACLAQDLLGLSPQESIEWVRQHIPTAIETDYQKQFVLRYRQ